MSGMAGVFRFLLSYLVYSLDMITKTIMAQKNNPPQTNRQCLRITSVRSL
jgi:hypothetical protein